MGNKHMQCEDRIPTGDERQSNSDTFRKQIGGFVSTKKEVEFSIGYGDISDQRELTQQGDVRWCVWKIGISFGPEFQDKFTESMTHVK